MGRPLFSTLYTTTASSPAVRVVDSDSEAPTPSYERWSYLNAFDPDADEFFAEENCVYEDFLPLNDTRTNASVSASMSAVSSVSSDSTLPSLVHQSTQSEAQPEVNQIQVQGGPHDATDADDSEDNNMSVYARLDAYMRSPEAYRNRNRHQNQNQARLTLRDLRDMVMPVPTLSNALNTRTASTNSNVGGADELSELIAPSDDGTSSSSSSSSNSGRSTPAYAYSEGSLLARRRAAAMASVDANLTFLEDELRRARSGTGTGAGAVGDMEFDDVVMDEDGSNTNADTHTNDDSTDSITGVIEEEGGPESLSGAGANAGDVRMEAINSDVNVNATTRPAVPLHHIHRRSPSSPDWSISDLVSFPNFLADENLNFPMPASPRPVPARAVSPGPTPGSFDAFVGSPGSFGMSPPGSVTPRFLTWGPTSTSTSSSTSSSPVSRRPRAVDMSPSPTPGAPFGSARALAYMSSPMSVRVHQ